MKKSVVFLNHAKTIYYTFKKEFTMRFFIDTAKVEDIKKANDMGVICGVTTNPSLIAKEGRDFQEVVKEITTIVDGPISAEVISLDSKVMVEEAKELIKIEIFSKILENL